MIWDDRDTFVRVLANRLAKSYGAPSAEESGSLRRSNTRGGKLRDLEYDANRWRRFIYLAAFRPLYFSLDLDRGVPHRLTPEIRHQTPDVAEPLARRSVRFVSFNSWKGYPEARSARTARGRYLKAQAAHTGRPRLYSYPLWHEYRLPRLGRPDRIIYIPHPALRLVHLEIMSLVSAGMASRFNAASFGMRSGTGGIRAHAQRHADSRYVAQFDLADCFPSITVPHLLRTLTDRQGLESSANASQVSTDVAVCLALLCTRRRRLVQGASSSPLLADLVLSEVDRRIEKALSQCLHGAVYSRYFDDLCISMSCKAVRAAYVDFRRFKQIAAQSVRDVVAGLDLAINPRKTSFTDRGRDRPLTVTGITLQGNRSVVPRPIRRRLRAMTHALKVRGLSHLLPQADDRSMSDTAGTTALDESAWDTVWTTVRAHRNLLARHLAPSGSSRFRSDSSRSWIPKDDRVSQRASERSATSRALSELPPVRNTGVPAHWLTVRLTITPDGASSPQHEDYVGRTAWNLLKHVVDRLSSNTASLREVTEQGGLVIAFIDDDNTRGTLGIRDSLGVVSKVLAVPPQSLLPLTRSLRSLHALLAHCLFVASAVGEAAVRPDEVLEVISQLASAWQRAPHPLRQQVELSESRHDDSRQEPFRARMETELEEWVEEARTLHNTLATGSWESILRSVQLTTDDFRHHRRGWTTALLKGNSDSDWFKAIDVLLESNRPDRTPPASLLVEPTPESLLRSCRIMSDRKQGRRLAHYTLRSDGHDRVTTKSSLTQQQKAVYRQAESLQSEDDGFLSSSPARPTHEELREALMTAIESIEHQGGLSKEAVKASRRQLDAVEEMLSNPACEATERLPDIACELHQLTLERVKQPECPSDQTPQRHKQQCQTRFLKGSDVGKRRVFETVRLLRNRSSHVSDVNSLRSEHRDKAEADDAIMTLRARCLELIGAFDSRRTPPDGHEHVLEHMMSPLEGREAAHELVRQVIEALKTWKPPTENDESC